jgi:hypothetical protein
MRSCSAGKPKNNFFENILLAFIRQVGFNECFCNIFQPLNNTVQARQQPQCRTSRSFPVKQWLTRSTLDIAKQEDALPLNVGSRKLNGSVKKPQALAFTKR